MFTIDYETHHFKLEECEGTLIQGTVRLQDIIPALLSAIVNTVEYEQLVANNAGTPAHAQEDDDADWWDSDEALFLMDELFGILNDYAPYGYYFGAHPGNVSDYGFWEIEEVF